MQLPLLSFLCFGSRWSAENIAVLLQRNADVTDRDEMRRTCLHHCFRRHVICDHVRAGDEFTPDHDSSDQIQRYSEAIILLVKTGADVYAEDNDGRSVSAYAYSRPCGKSNKKKISCICGDVWDFALAMCGYEISKFRQKEGVPRKPRYTACYTRQTFQNLWAGHENLCPYYDDKNHGLFDPGARVMPFYRYHHDGVMTEFEAGTMGQLITESVTDFEEEESDMSVTDFEEEESDMEDSEDGEGGGVDSESEG